MEKFALTLQSQPEIEAYLSGRYPTAGERVVLEDLKSAVMAGDSETVNWFAQFGEHLGQIAQNVNEYRRALEFGFTEIAFDQYHWFAAPKFLDFEKIALAESEIRLGRGPNGLWAYAIQCSYGISGYGGPLCVFCKKYLSREACLDAALNKLKTDISKYVGHADTTNFKQDVLKQTLKAIAALAVSRVQLTLF